MEETTAILLPEPESLSWKKAVKQESAYVLGSSAIIWQWLFFFIPLALMMVMSFLHLSEHGAIEKLTLAHFREILSPIYFSIIGASLALALSTAIICLIIAYPLAHIIARAKKRFKTTLLFFLIIPFWTNFLLHVCAWQFVLEREGFLNTILLAIGAIDEPLHLLNTQFAVQLMMVYYFLPFMVLPLFATLDKFNFHLVDAAYDLGAGKFKTFATIMLPLLWPAIRSGFFLVLIPAFGEFVIPELMGGDKHFFVGNVVSQYILGTHTAPLGSAFTLLSSICLIAFAALCNWSMKRGIQWLSRRRMG